MFYKLTALLLLIFALPLAAQDNEELRQGTAFSVLVTGSGPDVILIPGLATPRDVWKPLKEKLIKTHRLHIIQIRGFGDDPKNNAEDIAEGETLLGNIVVELADYIDDEITDKGNAAPAIIGHSLGGLSAMMIAAKHPNLAIKIMVVDSLPFFGLLFGSTMSAEAMKPQAEFLRTSIASQPNNSVDERGLIVQSISKQGRNQVKSWSKTADKKVMAQLFYEVATTDIRDELPAIKAPITMLYPIDISVMPASRISRIYSDAYANASDADLIPIENSRHFIMLDQKDIFETQVMTFLNSGPK